MRVDDLITIVAREFGVSRAQILGPQRHRPIMRARMAVEYIAFSSGRFSSPKIGRIMGRDHTSVLHACKVVPQYAARDSAYAAQINRARLRWEQSPPFISKGNA